MIKFRVHALRRMFERGISQEAVIHVLDSGDTIEQYPQDLPYPSRLILGWYESKPIHVVVADDAAQDLIIIVTAYRPDIEIWEAGFRRRKSK